MGGRGRGNNGLHRAEFVGAEMVFALSFSN